VLAEGSRAVVEESLGIGIGQVGSRKVWWGFPARTKLERGKELASQGSRPAKTSREAGTTCREAQ